MKSVYQVEFTKPLEYVVQVLAEDKDQALDIVFGFEEGETDLIFNGDMVDWEVQKITKLRTKLETWNNYCKSKFIPNP